MAVKKTNAETVGAAGRSDDQPLQTKVKFEVYGEEMIEKEVKSSGNSGRIYLPPNWIGHTVKIIKID